MRGEVHTGGLRVMTALELATTTIHADPRAAIHPYVQLLIALLRCHSTEQAHRLRMLTPNTPSVSINCHLNHSMSTPHVTQRYNPTTMAEVCL